MPMDLTITLHEATAANRPERDLLVWLAEALQDDPKRPCCDAETTLEDWVEIYGPSILARAAERLAFRNDHAAEIAQAEGYVRSRFFPPLPVEYGELAVLAVHAVNDGEPEREFDVSHVNPKPVGTRDGISCTARTLVNALRLWHLIDDDEDGE